jgi:predicted dinucleotide-binding enzyme
MSKIAILGSGPVGQVLVKGFTDAGHEARQVGRTGFADAAGWAEIIVLSIKGSVAVEVAGNLAAQLKGKVVIDTTNPIGDAPPVNGVLN